MPNLKFWGGSIVFSFCLHSEWHQTVFGFRWMLVQWFLDIAQISTFAGSQLVDDPLKVDPLLYDLLTCRPIDPPTTELSHISSPWDGDQVEWCHQWWLNTLLTCWPTDTPLYYWHITHNDPFWPIWGKHCWHLNLKFNLILFVKNQYELYQFDIWEAIIPHCDIWSWLLYKNIMMLDIIKMSY